MQAPGSSRGGRRVRSADQGDSLYQASWMLPSPEGLLSASASRRSGLRSRSLASCSRCLRASGVSRSRPLMIRCGRRRRLKLGAGVATLARSAFASGYAGVGVAPFFMGRSCGGGAGADAQGGSRPTAVPMRSASAASISDPGPSLETLHHMYMQCAVGRGALRWLAGLWGLVRPGGFRCRRMRGCGWRMISPSGSRRLSWSRCGGYCVSPC